MYIRSLLHIYNIGQKLLVFSFLSYPTIVLCRRINSTCQSNKLTPLLSGLCRIFFLKICIPPLCKRTYLFSATQLLKRQGAQSCPLVVAALSSHAGVSLHGAINVLFSQQKGTPPEGGAEFLGRHYGMGGGWAQEEPEQEGGGVVNPALPDTILHIVPKSPA